jgi:hypothetical protein
MLPPGPPLVCLRALYILCAGGRAVVYRFKPGGGDKPEYNSAPIHDFQRSLSFAAIRSSFDKMLVETDQNTRFPTSISRYKNTAMILITFRDDSVLHWSLYCNSCIQKYLSAFPDKTILAADIPVCGD